MQGIYLPEEPISLYGCESTKLYLGFSIRLSIKEKEAETGREYKRNGIIADIQGWRKNSSIDSRRIWLLLVGIIFETLMKDPHMSLSCIRLQ